MISDIQTRALENGIWVVSESGPYHRDVYAVNSKEIIVKRMPFAEFDYDENEYMHYNLNDYGKKWALTKEEILVENTCKYVLIKQIFFNSDQLVIAQKYEYEIEGNFKVGDLVCVSQINSDLLSIGKIVAEVPKNDTYTYKKVRKMTEAEKERYQFYLPLLSQITFPLRDQIGIKGMQTSTTCQYCEKVEEKRLTTDAVRKMCAKLGIASSDTFIRTRYFCTGCLEKEECQFPLSQKECPRYRPKDKDEI